MEHKHNWMVTGEQIGYVNVKCGYCGLTVELYPEHLEVWRYGDEHAYKGRMKLDYPSTAREVKPCQGFTPDCPLNFIRGS